jgi:hypothetical protein
MMVSAIHFLTMRVTLKRSGNANIRPIRRVESGNFQTALLQQVGRRVLEKQRRTQVNWYEPGKLHEPHFHF